ncbi:pseudouridine synthase [Acidihalobacter prosperus]
MLILFNKPYGVLSQFTDTADRLTLESYIPVPDVYPAGRLDRNSEGLLLLTDDGVLQHRISEPEQKISKAYWVQVEGIPEEKSLGALRDGIQLRDGLTRPCKAHIIEEPETLWPRQPPIRTRRTIPTCWLLITLSEGRNRQIRRMTAAIGHPTLRLIRYRIGSWTIDGIEPGQWLQLA